MDEIIWIILNHWILCIAETCCCFSGTLELYFNQFGQKHSYNVVYPSLLLIRKCRDYHLTLSLIIGTEMPWDALRTQMLCFCGKWSLVRFLMWICVWFLVALSLAACLVGSLLSSSVALAVRSWSCTFYCPWSAGLGLGPPCCWTRSLNVASKKSLTFWIMQMNVGTEAYTSLKCYPLLACLSLVLGPGFTKDQGELSHDWRTGTINAQRLRSLREIQFAMKGPF